MNKLAYFIITLFFLTMLPTSAEDENKGCKWETVEETEQFIREQCVGDGQLQVRMKSKPVPGITVIEAPNTKKSNPLKENNLLIHPSYHRKTKEEQAREMGISRTTLWRLEKQVKEM